MNLVRVSLPTDRDQRAEMARGILALWKNRNAISAPLHRLVRQVSAVGSYSYSASRYSYSYPNRSSATLFEYEYRCTEYEYDCPADQMIDAVQKQNVLAIPSLTCCPPLNYV